MIINYLTIAWRSLARQRGFAALNIVGLAVGIAAVLLIYRMVRFELSFNQNFKNYDRIVRVVTDEQNSDGEAVYNRGVPLPAMEEIKRTVPQFAASARIKESWPILLVADPAGGVPKVKVGMKEGQFSLFADPAFFQVFDFQWLTSDASALLNAPNTIVLSQPVAEQCFGQWANAPGKTLLVDNIPMLVQGVYALPPKNSDFPVMSVVSYSTLTTNPEFYDHLPDWSSISSNDQMYALLQDPSQFDAALQIIANVGQNEYKNGRQGRVSTRRNNLQRFSDLHYDDNYGASVTNSTPRSRLWVLSSIGFLILLMACFNFINLTTAQALRRSREVGVRKALGGARTALFGQFMAETALVVAFSIGFGVLLAWAASPLLKHISEVPTEWPFLNEPALWLFLAGVAVLVTLLSGSYPGMVLSGFSPVRALKNDLSQSAVGGAGVRKGLVVLQFLVAQALIIGTIITVGQLDYLRKLDLGFDQNLVYTFSVANDSTSQTKLNGFKLRLQQLAGVQSVTYGSDQPSSGSTWSTNFSIGRGTKDQPFMTNQKFCDADYQQTYGLKLVAGRWLMPSDTAKEYVVNEALLKKSGISVEEALQKDIRMGGGRWRPIVGVVKDFHMHSAHRVIDPIIIGTSKRSIQDVGVKINPQGMEATTAAIQREFDATFPEQVFEARYFDEQIAEFYYDENRFAATCKGFGGLAIFIACLGLFGLAAHAAQRRTKEIGIRKVLGASVAGITGLIARDFLILVGIAIPLASVLAYYFMRKWLADFEYRIDIRWWMFAVAGLAAVSIAFLTVGVQAVRAALANPVKSLRSE
jgi:putative ABC transport system permease protein